MSQLTEGLLSLSFAVDGRQTLARNPAHQWNKRDPGKIQGVCFHQSLDDLGSATGTARYDCGANHMSADGLPGLSYTGFIEPNGKLWVAWDIEEKTWSQGDAVLPGDENEQYVAFCFGGNFSGPGYQGTQHPTASQMVTAAALWQFWVDQGFRNTQLFGHYHMGKPACPGFDLMNFIESIRLHGVSTGNIPADLNQVIGRQAVLSQLGYYTGTIDGVWSPWCRYSLHQFQAASGLAADGVWGPMTQAAIIKALE